MTFKNILDAPKPCCCIGPQNGEPLCPCRMKSVKIKDGRYVLPAKDLGPVKEDIFARLKSIDDK